MNIQDIQTGDTLLINSNTFLSRMIQKVMIHWGKKRRIKDAPIYSHAARFAWIENELYVFGAIATGYKPLLFRKHFDLEKDDLMIMRRKKRLLRDDKTDTIHFMLHLDSISKSYQFWNFAQWLLLIYLNINTFGKDSDSFMYCYEAEQRARYDLNPEWYLRKHRVDIFDLVLDSNYKIIYRSRE